MAQFSLRIGFLILFLGFFVGGVADAYTPEWLSGLNARDIKKDYFSGEYKTSDRWEGTLCDGYTHLNAQVAGRVTGLDFDVRESGDLAVTASLVDVSVQVSGRYLSELSFCTEVDGTFPFEIDWIRAVAQVSFTEDQEGRPLPKIKITRTQFGTIHLVELSLPAWLEDFLTSSVNTAAKQVWASTLGDWINELITEELMKKFPKRGRL
ncbi:MAG: hypothetical protein HY537_06870 [Deltaproteobacteria bacterium]|nr:hypothetical protein [Deltaproteobacteria bacterium]